MRRWRHINAWGRIYEASPSQLTVSASDVALGASVLPKTVTHHEIDSGAQVLSLSARLALGDGAFYLRAKADDLWQLVVL